MPSSHYWPHAQPIFSSATSGHKQWLLSASSIPSSRVRLRWLSLKQRREWLAELMRVHHTSSRWTEPGTNTTDSHLWVSPFVLRRPLYDLETHPQMGRKRQIYKCLEHRESDARSKLGHAFYQSWVHCRWPVTYSIYPPTLKVSSDWTGGGARTLKLPPHTRTLLWRHSGCSCPWQRFVNLLFAEQQTMNHHIPAFQKDGERLQIISSARPNN